MKTLDDLFEHQIQDLYSAEEQLIKALPKMAAKSNDAELEKALNKHLEETKTHLDRVKSICDHLNISGQGEKCLAMEGLIKEAEHFMDEDMEEDILDAGIVAEAQRIEDYEISAYGTAARFAKELGYDDVASTLKTTLDEEYHADGKLTTIAEKRLNQQAKS